MEDQNSGFVCILEILDLLHLFKFTLLFVQLFETSNFIVSFRVWLLTFSYDSLKLGSSVNEPKEKVTGAKIWNSLCRYFYQKVSPSQLLAITIIIGLCANDQEAVEAYTVLDPQNDYMPGMILVLTL